MKLNAIIIDDEPENSEFLKHLIQGYTNTIQVAATFTNLKESISFIDKHKPDIVFLDIEMPENKGLEIFSMTQATDFVTVVVSAYDKFAIPAIKEGVFDYILKPINVGELHNCIDTIITSLREEKQATTLCIRNKGILEFRNKNNITYLEASGSYVYIGFDDKSRYLQSRNLRYYETLLDEDKFIRIHKSYLVNVSFIRSFDPKSLEITLNDGNTIVCSTRKRKLLMEKIRYLS